MDIRDGLIDAFIELGLSRENAAHAATEIVSSALEDTLQELLPASQLDQITQLTKTNDLPAIVKLLQGLEAAKFTEVFSSNCKTYLDKFIHNIIEQCPEGLLDDLQSRLQQLQQKFEAAGSATKKPASLEDIAKGLVQDPEATPPTA